MEKEKKTKKIDDGMCNIEDSTLIKLQKDIEQIKIALLGNEYNPEGGLLCRTSENEREIEKLKNAYNRVVWTAAGVVTTITIVINIVAYFIEL